jgi:predicted permease
MRRLLLAPAAILIVIGLVFALQGFGVLPGSFMTGERRWAEIGLGLIVVGLVVAYFGLATQRGRRRS